MPPLQELLRLAGYRVSDEAQRVERIFWSHGLCATLRSMLNMLWVLLLLLLLPMLQHLLWLCAKSGRGSIR
jgi:hypothetical protein